MASTSSSGHAQCEHSDADGVVCKCEEWTLLPSANSSEKYGGAGAYAADGCQECRQSGGSWRASGVCEWHEDRPGNVSSFGDEPASSLSEEIQEIPRVVSTTSTVMEQRSALVSVTNLLLGYMRYTFGLLACWARSLPCIRLNEHEEGDERNVDEDHEPESVCSADDGNIGDGEHSLERKHKIFLSHSGAQKDFVEQLCVDLEQCDRYPFFDKLRSSLPVGEKFPELIFSAIKQCEVGVVVLSEEFFTRSKWPMLELNAMVMEFEKPNARMRIIPVFYLISVKELKDPRNVRRWKSKWEEWIDKDGRIEVREWEEALRVLGAINSVVGKDGNGDVRLRKEIVMEICRLVVPETRWDDSHVEGRARTCKVIREKMDKLCASSSVGMGGLYGMGGIGKSTICRALCNDLSQAFCDSVCHVEMGSAGGIDLLRKALKKCTKMGPDFVDKLDDLEKGQVLLKKKLHGQPIFIALDNVQDHLKSIEAAQTYLRASFEPGSVVLVTARSLDVLKKLNLDEEQCLEMPELQEEEARSLFLNHAHVPSRNKVSEEVIGECIRRCHFLKSDGSSRHYHPLALKVLGQQLGLEPSTWAGQLYKIDTFNRSGDTEHPIFSILRTSFVSLKYELQLIVMDVALFSPYVIWRLECHTILDWLCMMHEESTEDMKHLLGILKRKSLLEDLDGGFRDIGMHDLWREFAVAKTMAKDIRDRHWVYQTDARSAIGRSGQWRENVERMGFMSEGWRGLKGLNLEGFLNLEALKLEVNGWMEDCELELDLRGLKHLKSLDVMIPRELTKKLKGLSSLSNLGYLRLGLHGSSPCIDGIGRLTNLQVLELVGCDGVQVLDVTELTLLVVVRTSRLPDLVNVRFTDGMDRFVRASGTW